MPILSEQFDAALDENAKNSEEMREMSEQPITPNTITVPGWDRLRLGMLGVAALGVFMVFSTWSGVPSGERAQPFWIGVAVLIVMLTVFSLVVWHLLVRPLPAGKTVEKQPIK